MIPRRLVITVGISLFHSASWKNEEPFANIQDYDRWLDHERLIDPRKRRAWAGRVATGAVIEERIRKLLSANPELPAAVQAFEGAFAGTEKRYSAELSTLMAMRLKLDPRRSFSAFVQAYTSIVFLHGEEKADESNVAARHLATVLKTYAGVDVQQRGIGGSIGEQLKQLIEFLAKDTNAPPTDLVATGGYKAFAIIMGHSYFQHASQGWRLFYLHESDMGDLIQEWRDNNGPQIKVGEVQFHYRPVGHLPDE